MSDYYATLKIQQGRLKASMTAMGIATASGLSRQSGVSQGTIGKILNFKYSPRAKNGEWKQSTLSICKALSVEPIVLFPEHLDHEMPTNKISTYVEQSQLAGMSARQLTPAEEIEESEMSSTIDDVLETLTGREAEVIRSRFFENKTLSEIARSHDVTAQTIRMNECKALRKLRHGSRINKLKEHCPFELTEPS